MEEQVIFTVLPRMGGRGSIVMEMSSRLTLPKHTKKHRQEHCSIIKVSLPYHYLDEDNGKTLCAVVVHHHVL